MRKVYQTSLREWVPRALRAAPSALALPLVVLSVALASSGLFVSYSYWFDELISVVGTRGSVESVFAFILSDVHPPLYYLMLHFWIEMFGTGEVATRALSALCALASLSIFVWFASQRLQATAAMVATAVFATNWMYAYYAQETRSYALLLMLATAVTAASVAFTDGGRRRSLCGLLACAALLSLTHYFGLVYAGAVLAVALYQARHRFGQAVAIVVVGTLCLIWPMIHFVFGALAQETGADFWIRSDGFQTTFMWLSKALAPQISLAAQAMLSDRAAQYLTAAVLIGLAALTAALCLAGSGHWRGSQAAGRRALASLLAIWVATVSAVVALDYASPASNDRNFIVLLPASALLLGWAAAGMSRDRQRWAVVAFVLVFCGSSFAGAVQKMYWKQQPMEDFRAAAAFVSRHPGSVYALVASQAESPLYRHMAAFYLPPSRAVRAVSVRRFGTLKAPYFVFVQHKSEQSQSLIDQWQARLFVPEQKNTGGVQVLYALKPTLPEPGAPKVGTALAQRRTSPAR